MITVRNKKIHQGDIGTKLVFDMGDDVEPGDISTARIDVKKPDGSFIRWDAVINGTLIEYTTKIGDLDQAGRYAFQPYVILTAGWVGHGDCVFEDVYPSGNSC